MRQFHLSNAVHVGSYQVLRKNLEWCSRHSSSKSSIREKQRHLAWTASVLPATAQLCWHPRMLWNEESFCFILFYALPCLQVETSNRCLFACHFHPQFWHVSNVFALLCERKTGDSKTAARSFKFDRERIHKLMRVCVYIYTVKKCFMLHTYLIMVTVGCFSWLVAFLACPFIADSNMLFDFSTGFIRPRWWASIVHLLRSDRLRLSQRMAPCPDYIARFAPDSPTTTKKQISPSN